MKKKKTFYEANFLEMDKIKIFKKRIKNKILTNDEKKKIDNARNF